MELNQFTKWKLIYEDETQCFSKAVDQETDNDVIVISYFNINDLSKTVRLLLNESLHNVMDVIEDADGLHIVINALKGTPLKNFSKSNTSGYSERVQMTYEWLKRIQLYEQFPDAIKIQLVDLDQIVVVEHQMLSRELIDYCNHDDIDLVDVFKQVGFTLDLILQDASGPQREFIDNLCVGTHKIFSFSLLRKQFKDIFIYEKDEALKSINYEYHIILNDRESGQPPLKQIKTESVPDPSDPVEDISPSIDDQIQAPEGIHEEFHEEVHEEVHEEPHEDDFNEDMPDVLPKIVHSRKDRNLDDALDSEVDDMFDDVSELDNEPVQINKLKLAGIIASVAIVIFIMAVLLFKPEPIEAKFKMDELPNNRVAFMNQSTGKEDTDTYLWEIFYEDTFVSSFTGNDLYPIFETEGDYTISLKIKDVEGNWSEPFVMDYTYKKE